jgi:LuxR family transcriptional activator of conjugal transfer of Ti plasmids
MRTWIEKLLDIPAFCSNRSMLQEALADLAAWLDFDAYAFVSLRAGEDFACSNYAREWQISYQACGYRQLDPVLRQAQRTRQAFVWSADGYRRRHAEDERRFFSHATDFGIVSGISMPVATANGSMSMLTFASSRSIPLAEDKIDAVAAAAAVGQLHACFEKLKVAPSVEGRFSLSAKEARYLQWLTQGKTVEDAAEIEGVKYNTVRIALAEARRRYDLCNNTQLVALAIRQGLI